MRPQSPSHVLVVVPARNEEPTIERSLQSLFAAATKLDQELSVVVAADTCTDGTAKIARRVIGGRGTVIEGSFGSVGRARSGGVRAGLSHTNAPLHRTWIASTDADTFVPPDWFALQIMFATQGYAAVAGVVQLERAELIDELVAERYAKTYTVFPDGTHPHVHAANLGLRADAYRRTGGWRSLVRSEDRDLWDRLRTAGYRTLATAELVVVTSARRSGRVPGGFGECLRQFVPGTQEEAAPHSTRKSSPENRPRALVAT